MLLSNWFEIFEQGEGRSVIPLRGYYYYYNLLCWLHLGTRNDKKIFFFVCMYVKQCFEFPIYSNLSGLVQNLARGFDIKKKKKGKKKTNRVFDWNLFKVPESIFTFRQRHQAMFFAIFHMYVCIYLCICVFLISKPPLFLKRV